MDKVCRWCKHYKNGNCTRDNFYVYDINDLIVDMSNEVVLEIKEPESFSCSNWE